MPRNNPDVVNKHGLHVSKARRKMTVLSRDMSDYTPRELARDLVKYAYRINPETTVITAEGLEQEAIKCNGR